MAPEDRNGIVPSSAINVFIGIVALLAFIVLVMILDNPHSNPISLPDKLWWVEKWMLSAATISYGMMWFARFAKNAHFKEDDFYIEFGSAVAAAFGSAFLILG
jgi:hypothetical protein